MRFLSNQRIDNNMALVVNAFAGGTKPARPVSKSAFFDAMNRAQSTTIRLLDADPYIEFENAELVDLLVARTVFSENEVSEQRHLFAPSERETIRARIASAKQLILEADPNLWRAIQRIVGSVAAYRIPDRDGGSVSCCIGLIWLSPTQEWTDAYCAEMLVHEFIHNSVFLDDMVNCIMPSPDLLERPEAQTISAIRKTKRAYDKAFHSACVTAGIMYFYHKRGSDVESMRYLPDLKRTVDDLARNDALMRDMGDDVLSENGRGILAELTRFVAGPPDYASITAALAS